MLFLCSRMAPLGDSNFRIEIANRFSKNLLVAHVTDAEARAPCIRELVTCDGAIVIADGTKGVGLDRLASSVFELELMIIATLGLPVHVIDTVGAARDPFDGTDLIRRMLRSHLFAGVRSMTWQSVAPTKASVLAAIRSIAEKDSIKRAELLPERGWIWLFEHRKDRQFIDEGSKFSFPFGETLEVQEYGPADDEGLESLLAKVEKIHNEGPLKKLALSWDLLRALSRRPWRKAHRRLRDAELWTGALRAWGSATAWLGQHGHTPLAQLPASTVLLKIAQEVRDHHPSKRNLLPCHRGYGAMASSYLSLAKRAGNSLSSWRMRLNGFEHVNLGLQECSDQVPRAGLLTVRGALQLSMFRMAGLDDLKEAERLHSLAEQESVGLAHARVQVAKAHAVLYKVTRLRSNYRVALERLHLARQRMEQEQIEFPECDRGQYLMCLETLASLHRSAGEVDHAAAVETQIGSIARELGYAGQLGRLKGLSCREWQRAA